MIHFPYTFNYLDKTLIYYLFIVSLAKKTVGDLVNLEVDAMGKHVESIVKSMLTGSREVRGLLETWMDERIAKAADRS